jgi:hypothetical protein
MSDLCGVIYRWATAGTWAAVAAAYGESCGDSMLMVSQANTGYSVSRSSLQDRMISRVAPGDLQVRLQTLFFIRYCYRLFHDTGSPHHTFGAVVVPNTRTLVGPALFRVFRTYDCTTVTWCHVDR